MSSYSISSPFYHEGTEDHAAGRERVGSTDPLDRCYYVGQYVMILAIGTKMNSIQYVSR